MIEKIKQPDMRERVQITTTMLEKWCRAFWEKKGIKLPKDIAIELLIDSNCICRFENKPTENKE